jgi:hypothetical protein
MLRRGPVSVYARKSSSRLMPRIALAGSAPRRACRIDRRLSGQPDEGWVAVVPSRSLRPRRQGPFVQVVHRLFARDALRLSVAGGVARTNGLWTHLDKPLEAHPGSPRSCWVDPT